MTKQSSYLRYLPPVLWAKEREQDESKQFLGQLLCVFEKILTGIPDGEIIGARDHPYPPLQQLIDTLPQLFNPRQTRQDLLPWLASWIALELQPTWSEFQQRRLIGEMTAIYQLRGLEQGLHTYLDIYAKTSVQPRIAIDDGSALVRTRFRADGTATLHTFARSQVVANTAATQPVLIHPVALVEITPDGEDAPFYLVADSGVDPASDDVSLQKPALWRVSASGELPYARTDSTPLPLPVHTTDDSFYRTASAAVVDGQNRCSVISIGEPRRVDQPRSQILRFDPPPTFAPSVLIGQTGAQRLPAIWPVDMVLDDHQRFVILDRGALLAGDPPNRNPANPKLIILTENADQSLTIETHDLPNVAEPTALLFLPDDGAFIVADATNQFSDAAITTPANLIRVNPAAGWATTSLLHSLPPMQNPLIFPTGLVQEGPNTLLVCDTGLRWRSKGDPSVRAMAEPAAIYRVHLDQTPPLITQVTHQPKLVHPTKMIRTHRGELLIADRGDSFRGTVKRNWRARPNEFGVIVHFSLQREPTRTERNQIRRGISQVVAEQKPNHVAWWLKSE
ncbi:MAG: phage tail protein [Caldilineaceae bacterium]